MPGKTTGLAAPPTLEWIMGWIMLALALSAAEPRSRELAVPATGKTGFTRLPSELTGVTFTNFLAEERHLTNQIYLNGSGVALGDVDGDGWCDLLFCGLDSPNRLYRNLGQWKFEDITTAAGVACVDLATTGAAFADLDGDGDLDLVLNSVGGGTHCFFNDGQGRFREMDRNPVLNPRLGGTSLALGDVDGDGDLDLYVANYRTVTIRDQPNTKFAFRIVDGKPQVNTVDGRPITDPDLAHRFTFRITLGETKGTFAYDENGEPDVLYLNDGTGRFTAASFTDGRFRDEDGHPLNEPPYDWGLSVMFRDLNGDLAPDIYVCNDFRSPDRIWINDGTGRFRALPRLAIRQSCLSSMGVDVADLNRDGHDDIFVLDMLSREHGYRLTQRIDLRPEVLPLGAITNRPQSSRNMLYLNRGDGTYAEIAQYSGLEAAEWAWMPVLLDVDLDGYEDVLIPNGFERDNMNVDSLQRLERMKKEQQLPPQEQLRLRKMFPRLENPNLAFRNLGNLKFEEMGAAWGFNTPGISQGMALADLDNDGDLDVVVNNLNTGAGLYRNDSAAPRVAVRLKGLPPNTRGIGAKLRLLGGPVPQSQEMIAGGRYLSGDDALRVFACGQTKGGMTLEVAWRSGRRSKITDVQPNRLYVVEEASAVPLLGPPAPPPVTPSLFRDVSQLLQHQHHEEPFDDFAHQPMLPKRLSQLGPGLCWFDVDNDGWDDLVVGSGRGGQMAVYRNDGRGAFQRVKGEVWDQAVPRDQTTILGWRLSKDRTVLLAGAATYEDGATNVSPVVQYDWPSQTATNLFGGHSFSVGPLALADLDGDGDLDLFVGGRVVPRRYAAPASSLVFRAEADGRFILDSENTKRLAGVGLVSAAVFSDLDGDGDPDLLLACDWGPVRVFRNAEGQFTEATAQLGLDKYRGWWNGITTGDFDGDGRLDIVAANWGLNSKYEFYRRRALHLFWGDVDGNGTVEVIEAYYNPDMNTLAPLQSLHLLQEAMPLVAERLGSCASYSKQTLHRVYGATLKNLQQIQVDWLESTVFLNRGTHFEARVLPAEAQWAPAFGVCVGDLDGDGQEDVLLSQNFFAVPSETSRSDAGRGLWLRGDGRGHFTPVPGQQSGILVYGEQRGAALSDFDGDGRVDVAVAQNAAETKLYKNVGAQPGWRVRLAGPAGNPHGVGAVLRLMAGQRGSPAREIHAGSGYWSQDSAVPVLSAAFVPTHLWVRWPGGKVTTTELPSTGREITVDETGRRVQP